MENQLLTSDETAQIRGNLFEGAQHIVSTLPPTTWHRDRSGSVTASRRHSSQALALDVFATIGALNSRDAIANAWATELKIPNFGRATIEPESLIPRDLLGEPKSTQVDAIIHGSLASALVECKFTEPDGGACSQPTPRKRPDGKAVAQCNGSYAPQVNPLSTTSPAKLASCALTAKGVRYWDYIPEVLGVRADVVHQPCPYAGGAYQWMRNLVSAHALTLQSGRPHSFLIAYADGPFPMSRKLRSGEWAEFRSNLTDTVTLQTVSFQTLVAIAKRACAGHDMTTMASLADWVNGKIRAAAAS